MTLWLEMQRDCLRNLLKTNWDGEGKGKMGTYSGIFPLTDWLLGLEYSIPNDLHYSLVDLQIELRRDEGKGRIHGSTSA